MREHPDGTVTASELRVRFGEVEARGIRVSPAGQALVDPLPADAHAWAAACRRPSASWLGPEWPGSPPLAVPTRWTVTSRVRGRPTIATLSSTRVRVRLEPVACTRTSCPGPRPDFRSNLTEDGTAAAQAVGVVRDAGVASGALSAAPSATRWQLYAAQVEGCWGRTLAALVCLGCRA